MRVKEQGLGPVRLQLDIVVDVEVLEVRDIVLVLDFDSGSLIEGPLEVAGVSAMD